MSKCHYYLAPGSSTSAINGTILALSCVPWRKINYVECFRKCEAIFSIVKEGR